MRTPELAAARAVRADDETHGRTRPPADLGARLRLLLGGPPPRSGAEWDLVAAVRALRLPGAPPYRGPLTSPCSSATSHPTPSTTPPWPGSPGCGRAREDARATSGARL
jgi:hypothetical protein